MKTLAISLKIFLFFTVLTGIIYPLLVTGIAQFVFPFKANGSIIIKNNVSIGSDLIGQKFDSTIYFSSRPSAVDYNPLPSGGSNIALTNVKLKEQLTQRKKQFIAINHLDSKATVPSEMLFASASGLDPHISPMAASMQLDRIVKARNLTTVQKQQLIHLIAELTESPQYLLLGEARVNVLRLNLALDALNHTNSTNK
ncbi:MAG: potassium-transporting ATPase subunit KdpC [Bacteroidota bacterium]